MQVFEVSSKDLKFGDRLVPAFYYNHKIREEDKYINSLDVAVLGQYATISDGEHSAIPRNKKGGVRYIYGRNIKEGVVNFDPISDDSFIDEMDYNITSRCHINEDDVLIAILGTVGKSAVYKSEYIGKAGIPRHIANITVTKQAPFTPEFLSAFFRTRYAKSQMFSLMTGNIQQLLTLKNLREFKIPLVNKDIIKKITEKEKEAIDCEILAQEKIREAQDIFYDGLKFDINSICGDFSFNTKKSELDEASTWSPKYFNKIYIRMSKALEENNGVELLGDIVSLRHGDEVGSELYKEYINRDFEDKAFIRTSDIVNYEVDLYPDYYIDNENLEGINQKLKFGDVIFTKDGKIGATGMITDFDNIILSSGIEILRLNKNGIDKGFTQEYLFTALSIPEIGLYSSARRTVVASTIPHLREERLKTIEIPIEDRKYIEKITCLIKDAFKLKEQRKRIIIENDKLLDKLYNVSNN